MSFFFTFQTFTKILQSVTILTLPEIAWYYVTITYKYITLNYTMNFNGKVTIQEKEKYILSTDDTRVQRPESISLSTPWLSINFSMNLSPVFYDLGLTITFKKLILKRTVKAQYNKVLICNKSDQDVWFDFIIGSKWLLIFFLFRAV